MKKLCLVILTMIMALSVCSCANDGMQSSGDVDGMYRFHGLYKNDADGEEGYLKIVGSKATFNMDGDPIECDFYMDGDLFRLSADGNTLYGIIRNGVAFIMADGVYAACKTGKNPNDIYSGCDKKDGKYLLWDTAQNTYYPNLNGDIHTGSFADSIVFIGNAFILENGRVCGKVEYNGDRATLKYQATRGEAALDGQFEMNVLHDGAVSVKINTWQGKTETKTFCKLGYTPDGALQKENSYKITFIGNGGTYSEIFPIERICDNGRLAMLPHAWGNPEENKRDFCGYNTKADGSGEKVTANTVFTADTVLYAMWGDGNMPPSIITPSANNFSLLY